MKDPTIDIAHNKRKEQARKAVETAFVKNGIVTLAEIQQIAFTYLISLRQVNEMLYKCQQGVK